MLSLNKVHMYISLIRRIFGHEGKHFSECSNSKNRFPPLLIAFLSTDSCLGASLHMETFADVSQRCEISLCVHRGEMLVLHRTPALLFLCFGTLT